MSEKQYGRGRGAEGETFGRSWLSKRTGRRVNQDYGTLREPQRHVP